MITLRPNYRQLFASNLMKFILSILLLCAMPYTIFNFSWYINIGMLLLPLLCAITFLIQYIEIRNTSWTINDNQICCQQGVFTKRKNFVELYRVVDYSELQTFYQRLFGIKTVIITSTDRLQPALLLYGIPANLNVIDDIRNKVEQCKENNKIYEIANTN